MLIIGRPRLGLLAATLEVTQHGSPAGHRDRAAGAPFGRNQASPW
jgi:hypothetical protein